MAQREGGGLFVRYQFDLFVRCTVSPALRCAGAMPDTWRCVVLENKCPVLSIAQVVTYLCDTFKSWRH